MNKRLISFTCVAIIVLGVGFWEVASEPRLTLAQEDTNTVTYTANDVAIANPERGLYHYSETRSGSYTPLSQTRLERWRENEDITLVFRYFFLEDFTDSPISQQYLNNIRNDFEIVRAAGLKMIPRFAYTDETDEDYNPPYGDAPKAQILEHIDQLQPILRENKDVIATIQLGFIGVWGEGYYTDYFADPNAPDEITEAQYDDRAEILAALAAAVGDRRKVQIRNVFHKPEMLDIPHGVGSAIMTEEAHGSSLKAQIGHHNDCFLGSDTDYGTYRWDSIASDKQYLEQESQHVPVGGESCNVNPPRSQCSTALAELERFHWSYLNTEYHPDIIEGWQIDGCWQEIKDKIGYRFELESSAVSMTGSTDNQIDLIINLRNTGWAAPYNPRDVYLILRPQSGGEVISRKLKVDPRFWLPETDIAIEELVDIPSNVPVGTYDLLLHLPDPDLSDRPAYAIRLANQNTWEPSTGYNDLLLDIEITDSTDSDAETDPDSHSDLRAVDDTTTPVMIENDVVDDSNNVWPNPAQVSVNTSSEIEKTGHDSDTASSIDGFGGWLSAELRSALQSLLGFFGRLF